MYTIKVNYEEMIGLRVALGQRRERLLNNWLLSHEHDAGNQMYWAVEIQKVNDAESKTIDYEYSEVNN
jgi:hypothetical protein